MCSCGNVAVHEWMFHLCSDDNTERVLKLCSFCDIALNGHVLRLLGDKDVGKKIAAYTAKELAHMSVV